MGSPTLARAVLAIATLILHAQIAGAADPTVEVLIGSKAADPGSKPPPGKLFHPFGVAFDSAGNMIVVEYTGGRIFKRTPSGQLSQIGGVGRAGYAGDGGPVTKASFKDMHNIVIGSDGSMYISDHKNHAIRRVDTKGNISTYAGGKAGFAGDGQTVDKAQFNFVMSVSIDPAKKYLVIADIKNRRIRRITLSSGLVETVAGNGKKGIPSDGAMATKAPLIDPRAAAYDATGNLYIVERGGHALRVVSTDGKIRTVAGSGKKGNADGVGAKATFNGPKHLTMGPTGMVYIADDNNHRIRRYDPKSGAVTTVLGHGAFKLNRPHGVLVRDGWLYVSDSWNHRIVRLKLKVK
jgi:hypothetical protein